MVSGDAEVGQYSTRRLPGCDGGSSGSMVKEGWSARTRPGRRPETCWRKWAHVLRVAPRIGAEMAARARQAAGRGMNLAGPAAPGPERQESWTQERRRWLCCACVLFVSSIGCACLPVLSDVSAHHLMPAPGASHAALVLVYGGCSQFRRGSRWTDIA